MICLQGQTSCTIDFFRCQAAVMVFGTLISLWQSTHWSGIVLHLSKSPLKWLRSQKPPAAGLSDRWWHWLCWHGSARSWDCKGFSKSFQVFNLVASGIGHSWVGHWLNTLGRTFFDAWARWWWTSVATVFGERRRRAEYQLFLRKRGGECGT